MGLSYENVHVRILYNGRTARFWTVDHRFRVMVVGWVQGGTSSRRDPWCRWWESQKLFCFFYDLDNGMGLFWCILTHSLKIPPLPLYTRHSLPIMGHCSPNKIVGCTCARAPSYSLHPYAYHCCQCMRRLYWEVNMRNIWWMVVMVDPHCTVLTKSSVSTQHSTRLSEVSLWTFAIPAL